MKLSYLFLAAGFEEIEAVTVVDVLRRAGVNIKTVSMTGGLEVSGEHGIVLLADLTYEGTTFDDADFYILPGGAEGTRNLFYNDDFKMTLLDHYNKGKKIAAIGESPSLLGELNMLTDKNATCTAGLEKFLNGATYTAMPIEIQDNILTGKGPEAAMKFAVAIVSLLLGKDAADKVSKELLLILD